ncbi:MAG TPA: peptidase M61, partial [Myxococcota bacterium]|nr:peptidase M61 [Myxococcota bacterium]
MQYSVDLKQFQAHIFTVKMTTDSAKANQLLSLPTWAPGSYMVREFSQHILSVKAFSGGAPVEVSKTNKNTYQLKNRGSSVTVCYEVYAFDPSIRAAFIDDTQAFFNGTSLFFRPHGLEDAHFLLNLVKPEALSLAGFEVATTMPAVDRDQAGFGTYQAFSYQELVDYPCQISKMTRLKFSVGNIPHQMVLVGDVRAFDEKRLVNDLSAVCQQPIALFGDEVPFDRYLFIARFEENGHGGLEHRNSSMLLSTPYGLPKAGMGEPDSHYRNFLGLCSHEYFHAWNVKSLKPSNFVTYDFDHECYTTMLWIFEGLTSYYDDLLVKRAGLVSLSSYLELLSKNYSRLLKNKGRFIQSIAESSFDAWIKFYRPNENSLNTSVSYYLKGGFIGLYLDLLIRCQSNHRLSLDNVIKTALDRFGNNRGIEESQFFDLLAEVGQIDVNALKQKYIYGTEDLPLKDLLNKFAIDFSLTADEMSLDDRIRMSASLGVKLRFDDNGRALISFVEYGGPAMQAGLSPHDEIIALNNIRLDET